VGDLGNVGHLAAARLAAARLVVLDLSTTPFLDMQSAHTLAKLVDEMAAAIIVKNREAWQNAQRNL